MQVPILNHIYQASCNVCNHVAEAVTPIVNKTLEFAKQFFSYVAPYAFDIAVGVAILACVIIYWNASVADPLVQEVTSMPKIFGGIYIPDPLDIASKISYGMH